jgi:hypothetical protein
MVCYIFLLIQNTNKITLQTLAFVRFNIQIDVSDAKIGELKKKVMKALDDEITKRPGSENVDMSFFSKVDFAKLFKNIQ